MTRRARMGPIQTLGRGVDRMAPGGRRSAAESPIRPFHRPVGEAGGVEEEAPGEVCVDLVADPNSHTFRPAGGGTFTAPVGKFWYVSLVLIDDVPGDPLRYDFYNSGGTLTNIYTVRDSEQGPFTAGKTIKWWSSAAGTWERIELAYGYTGPNWVAASGARFCYTDSMPAAAATAREADI